MSENFLSPGNVEKSEFGRRSSDETIPVPTLFEWFRNGKLSREEFEIRIKACQVDEIVLGPECVADSGRFDDEEGRKNARIREIRLRLKEFWESTETDEISEETVREHSGSYDCDAPGLGIVLEFEKTEDDEDGKATNLMVEFRIPPVSRERFSSVRGDAVFSGPLIAEDGIACSIILPLPLFKNGRRRLFATVVDAVSKTPVPLPPDAAMAFREKCLKRIRILGNAPKTRGLIASIAARMEKVFK